MNDDAHLKHLAINGGAKTLSGNFDYYNPYGDEELNAAVDVIRSGKLSCFLGAWSDDFYGGEQVKSFEAELAQYFDVRHAVTFNSLTSGLIAAVGALDIGPGDEVIVSPWTMSASASCVLVWNAIPVFADIDKNTFNLDPESVAEKVSPKTKAIVVPDIFGYSADIEKLQAIAKTHNVKIIEDAAQAPGVRYRGRYVGTHGDIGGFSLNYHKHIHTGEGGICVTDDDNLAERMRLIRNHAEAVVGAKGETNLANMLGFNFRLGEIEAAMGRQQLKKLDAAIQKRFQFGQKLTACLRVLEGLSVTEIEEGSTHAYYVFGMTLDTAKLGISRSKIVNALRAEGVDALAEGYINIHRYPMYEKKIVYGQTHYPWTMDGEESTVQYGSGTCPVAEALHDSSYFGLLLCQYDFTETHIDLIAEAFQKVWRYREELM